MPKMTVTPHAVGQVQVVVNGLAKERAHQVRVVPPEARGDPINDVVIADKDGHAAHTTWLYASGEWAVEVRLNGADEEPLIAETVTL